MFESLAGAAASVPRRDLMWETSGLVVVGLADRPSLAAVRRLLAVDPAALDPDAAISHLQEWERVTAWLDAIRVRSTAAVNRTLVAAEEAHLAGTKFVEPQQAAIVELTAALHLSERAVTDRVDDADLLTGQWRTLLTAVHAGDVTLAHARAIGRELRKSPAFGDPARADVYERCCRRIFEVVVPYARTHTPAQCARRTALLVCAEDPAGAQRRRREVAELDHGVFLQSGSEPGTCELVAVVPVTHAQAMYCAIDTLAHDSRFVVAPGCVTIGQRRVAAMTTLMLGEPGRTTVIDGPVSEAKITAHIDVVVPIATVLGASDRGGRVGTDPATADVILDLLADCDPTSTLRRLVVDANESVVDLGRSRYAVSDVQRRVIVARDRTCRHPGCARAAARCEIDHARPWDAGGSTDLENLGALCKFHHQAKTHGGWTITASSRDGHCRWRSPLGRIYEHEPPPLLPPPS